MARIDYKQECRWAQKDIYMASRYLSTAKMRLSDTKYASVMNNIWDSLTELNNILIREARR